MRDADSPNAPPRPATPDSHDVRTNQRRSRLLSADVSWIITSSSRRQGKTRETDVRDEHVVEVGSPSAELLKTPFPIVDFASGLNASQVENLGNFPRMPFEHRQAVREEKTIESQRDLMLVATGRTVQDRNLQTIILHFLGYFHELGCTHIAPTYFLVGSNKPRQGK